MKQRGLIGMTENSLKQDSVNHYPIKREVNSTEMNEWMIQKDFKLERGREKEERKIERKRERERKKGEAGRMDEEDRKGGVN